MTPLRQEFEQFKADLRREGAQQGRAEGIAEGKAEALLVVLAARGVVVNEATRKKILLCQDQPILDRWLLQSLTAASADEVLAAAA